jgi:hypothetical protein
LEQKSRVATLSGANVSRPFTDAVLGTQEQLTVANSGLGIGGRLAVSQGIRLNGFDVGLANNLLHTCDWSADFLVGFRYLDLDEYLAVSQVSSVPAGLLATAGPLVRTDAAAGLALADRFRTRNQFFGTHVGVRGEYRHGALFANLTAEVGIGNVHQRVDIDGSTAVTGRPAVPGGLLAVPGGNFGSTVRNRFAVLTEVGLSAGYQFAPWGRARVGYDLLYLNDVARPGLQVDAVVNPRLVPSSRPFGGTSGPASPVVTGRTDDFFAHGLRFGLEVLY